MDVLSAELNSLHEYYKNTSTEDELLQRENQKLQEEVQHLTRKLESLTVGIEKRKLLEAQAEAEAAAERSQRIIPEGEMKVYLELAMKEVKEAREEIRQLHLEKQHAREKMDEFGARLAQVLLGNDAGTGVSDGRLSSSMLEGRLQQQKRSHEGEEEDKARAGASDEGKSLLADRNHGNGVYTGSEAVADVSHLSATSFSAMVNVIEEFGIDRHDLGDDFIRSMHVVVNERNRCKRLCRQQQLAILALRYVKSLHVLYIFIYFIEEAGLVVR
jgi:FtsZ-binding cell division protein ZapB